MLAAKLAPEPSEETKLSSDEPTLREKVVSNQREIEEALAYDKEGRAVFFVKFPLTPMYISHKAVEFNKKDQVYELKKDYKQAIPEDLIPKDKLKEPKQLSTVLGRVLSLWNLKENSVIIFYFKDRGDVDDHEFNIFKEEHPNFKLIRITEAEYDEFKSFKPKGENVAEATYAYTDQKKQAIRQCIFATQIINPNLPSNWQVLEGHETQASIEHLNELLVHHNQELIPVLTRTPDTGTEASIRALPNVGIFISQPANDNTNSLSEEPCLSPSCPSSK